MTRKLGRTTRIFLVWFKCSQGLSVFLNKILYFRLPVAKPNCSWDWKNITIKEINSWTADHFKNQNSMIILCVKDIGAFKFFQHQVTELRFLNSSFSNDYSLSTVLVFWFWLLAWQITVKNNTFKEKCLSELSFSSLGVWNCLEHYLLTWLNLLTKLYSFKFNWVLFCVTLLCTKA